VGTIELVFALAASTGNREPHYLHEVFIAWVHQDMTEQGGAGGRTFEDERVGFRSHSIFLLHSQAFIACLSFVTAHRT
jgi:hypothetical protein